jgi:hypothetical protein
MSVQLTARQPGAGTFARTDLERDFGRLGPQFGQYAARSAELLKPGVDEERLPSPGCVLAAVPARFGYSGTVQRLCIAPSRLMWRSNGS